MDTYDALRQADEVRTFPNIAMPPPTFKVHTGRTSYSRQKELLAGVDRPQPVDGFPGLLRSKRSTVSAGRQRESPGSIFTGFNNISLKLDVKDATAELYQRTREQNLLSRIPGVQSLGSRNPTPAVVDIGSSLPPTRANHHGMITTTAATTTEAVKDNRKPVDPAMEELRNYIMLMDKYSMHNFLIYEGHTLKETPEFQSFQRTFQYKWGSISSIIFQLEDFLTKNDVKLAIVNGPRLFELAKYNLPVLPKKELFSCISNIEQIEASLDAGFDVSQKQMIRLLIKIQSVARMYIARKRYKQLKYEIHCATMMQAMTRRMLQRIIIKKMQRNDEHEYEAKKRAQWKKIQEWWRTRSIDPSLDRRRLIIFLPSLSAPEYVRLHCEDFAAMQNTAISNLYQLADPAVNMIYIAPLQQSGFQAVYHEKMLALMGVSLLPRRLQFLTPEVSSKLPDQLSLAQQLWYSSGALRKLRQEAKKYKQCWLMATSLGWAEKRIAKFLKIPIFSAEPQVAETFSSRSFFKTFLMETGVSIPIGAHDVYSVDDLILSLTRLISSNLGIQRWIIRLNCDNNQESLIFFDVEKLSLIKQLRAEQTDMIGDKDNTASWYSKPIQLAVRKRILVALKKEFLSKIRICRRDIFRTWEQYAKLIRVYGVVIEAEPLQKIGYVMSTAFINPLGEVELNSIHGFQEHVDERYQVNSYSYPQEVTPPLALQGVTQALASRLFKEHQIVGHVTFHFVSFWDALDRQPRLWGRDIRFGPSPIFGAIGTAAMMTNTSPQPLPLSLVPSIPEGVQFIYIPFAAHEPLRGTHDDEFFKVCKLRGIAYDMQNKLGSLFFLPDSTVGGTLSLLCINKTRIKTLELTINTLSFVMRNFGLEKASNGPKRCENLQKICSIFKKILKEESGGDSWKSNIIDIGNH